MSGWCKHATERCIDRDYRKVYRVFVENLGKVDALPDAVDHFLISDSYSMYRQHARTFWLGQYAALPEPGECWCYAEGDILRDAKRHLSDTWNANRAGKGSVKLEVLPWAYLNRGSWRRVMRRSSGPNVYVAPEMLERLEASRPLSEYSFEQKRTNPEGPISVYCGGLVAMFMPVRLLGEDPGVPLLEVD